MRTVQLPYERIPQVSKRDALYAARDERLRPFYDLPPDYASFPIAIERKQGQHLDRDLLVDVLTDQYQSIPNASQVRQHIEALRSDSTFCITTAHQPCLFTGPLYTIYKLISTIRLSQVLGEKHPAYRFVPVFVSGGEDHDFDEVNHCYVFQHRLEWQSTQTGAVGRFSLDGLEGVIAEVDQILGPSPEARQWVSSIKEAGEQSSTYAQFNRRLIHALFGRFGLIVLNMDDARLKAAFRSVLKSELFDQVSKPLIEATQHDLEDLGLKAQAHARPINLFYLGNGFRERIVPDHQGFSVANTDIRFSKTAMLKEVDEYPERFSPNVVLRPIYQEYILPNLAYVGGGGELAYWMERKSQFAHFGMPYPLLIRRNSALWVDRTSNKRMRNAGLSIDDFFAPEDDVVRKYVEAHTEDVTDTSEAHEAIEKALGDIVEKGRQMEESLGKALAAERVRLIKAVDQMRGRIHRAAKQKHDVELQRIRRIRQKLFPDNGLQERRDNFLPYYLKYGDAYFDMLMANLDPMSTTFTVFLEE